MWFERVMAWVKGDDAKWRGPKIRAFQIILIFHMWAECWEVALDYLRGSMATFAPALFVPAAVSLLALYPRTRRIGFIAIAILALAWLVVFFPDAGNHNMLAFLFAGMSAFLKADDESDQKLFIGAVRWIIVLVFFYSGVQKFIHGYYFHGELFAYYMTINENYAAFFRHFLPADEVSRILSLKGEVGDGPYRIDSPMVLVMSNATYLLEMVLPIMLVVRRTRLLAVVVTMVTFVAIQLAARELFFGGLFASALLLFLRTDLNRRLVWVFVAYYLWLVLMMFHVIPGFMFG